MAISAHTFECHMYVARDGSMRFNLPAESGPQRVAYFEPLRYDDLMDPGFRRLLAAFHGVGSAA